MSDAFRWVSSCDDAPIPPNAVEGGRDCDGCTIYIGRAYHNGDILPAKLVPERRQAYVCYGGEEHVKHDYEVLCHGEFEWVFASNGYVPPGAVVGGHTSDGECLYIGRVIHQGSQTVGKLQRSHSCVYIPFNGEELSFQDYEVLVYH